MVFSSLIFIFMYLCIVLPIYYILPRKVKNLFLFVASLVFYGYGEPVFIILMIISVTINYLFGILIEKYADNKKKSKALLAVNVLINLAMLEDLAVWLRFNVSAETLFCSGPIFS